MRKHQGCLDDQLSVQKGNKIWSKVGASHKCHFAGNGPLEPTFLAVTCVDTSTSLLP